jgi:hypothetical protein
VRIFVACSIFFDLCYQNHSIPNMCFRAFLVRLVICSTNNMVALICVCVYFWHVKVTNFSHTYNVINLNNNYRMSRVKFGLVLSLKKTFCLQPTFLQLCTTKMSYSTIFSYFSTMHELHLFCGVFYN